MEQRTSKLERAQARADELVSVARMARNAAHAPYSKYYVGAAVAGGSGRIYAGCNVENASYGLTICAERVAIFKAISEGEETIDAVAVVAEEGKLARPCGACLQVIAEFSDADDPVGIICASLDGMSDMMPLTEYLPHSFKL